MKHIILTATAAIGLTSAAFAGPGPGGSGFMDDLITPYDDSKIELPGENVKKPSVSRYAQLGDDRETGARKTRETESKPKQEKQTAQPKSGKTSSASSSTSRDDDSDGDQTPVSRRTKVNEIMGEGVPEVMSGSKQEKLLHNPAREATKLAPTTPARWTRAPNDWYCDFDDAMDKAALADRLVVLFFHSSTNITSQNFMKNRMENNKFKSKTRDRVIIVYLDFPENFGTSKDKRNRDQIAHNKRILDKFQVSSFPTLVFLDSSGSEIGRIVLTTSIAPKSLEAFLKEVDRIIQTKDAAPKNSNGYRIGGNIEFEVSK